MDNNQEPQVQEPAAEKKFTQAELDEIIGKRLAKERAKFEEQLKSKVGEAERLAKLNEEERAREEIKIAQDNLDKMTAEFNKMKADFEQQQMLAQVTKELSDRNLPIGMANNLIGKDAEVTKANIDAFENTSDPERKLPDLYSQRSTVLRQLGIDEVTAVKEQEEEEMEIGVNRRHH